MRKSELDWALAVDRGCAVAHPRRRHGAGFRGLAKQRGFQRGQRLARRLGHRQVAGALAARPRARRRSPRPAPGRDFSGVIMSRSPRDQRGRRGDFRAPPPARRDRRCRRRGRRAARRAGALQQALRAAQHPRRPATRRRRARAAPRLHRLTMSIGGMVVARGRREQIGMHRHFRRDADQRERARPAPALAPPPPARSARPCCGRPAPPARRRPRHQRAASSPPARRCRRAPAPRSRRGRADRRRARRGRAAETRASASPRRCGPCRRRAGRSRSGRPAHARAAAVAGEHRASLTVRAACQPRCEARERLLRDRRRCRPPLRVPTDSRTMSSPTPDARELLGAHLPMRRAGGVDHQRLGVADIGEMAREPQRLDEPRARPRGRP